MPANPKYLTSSKSQRFAKIFAAFPLAYLLSTSFHLALACWLERRVVVATMTFSLFILWGLLMFVPFLFKNGWKCWLIYIGLSILFGLLALVGKYHYTF